jgi:integral membrane sensor domain MASE1
MRKDCAASTGLNLYIHTVITAIGLGLIACLNAMVAPQLPGVITSLWYVNPIAVVFLLYASSRCRLLLLSGYSIGLSIGYWFNGISVASLLSFMLANLAEIITAYLLLQRSQYARNFYFDLHSALQLGIYGILLPSLVGVLFILSASILQRSEILLEIGIDWYVNSVICSTSVMPLLLLIKHRRWNSRTQLSLALQLLLLFCYVTLILKYFPFPFVYLGLGLALLALRNGVFGAAVAGFLVSFCIAVFKQCVGFWLFGGG